MKHKMVAHLRFHFRITPRQWKKSNYSDEEIVEWYNEFYYIKEQLGEVKSDK